MPQLSLEQQQDLASLAYELGHNPQTREGLASLVFKLNPQRARQSFPDVAQSVKFKELERKIDEKIDLHGARAAQEKVNAERDAVKARYSEDEFLKIEKELERTGGHSYEDAAILYAAKHGPADPRDMPPDPSERPGARWEFPTVQGRDGRELDFKHFAADPSKHSLNAAYNVIHEFKQSRLSPGFRR
jgi:hypothetical protein